VRYTANAQQGGVRADNCLTWRARLDDNRQAKASLTGCGHGRRRRVGAGDAISKIMKRGDDAAHNIIGVAVHDPRLHDPKLRRGLPACNELHLPLLRTAGQREYADRDEKCPAVHHVLLANPARTASKKP
jgi:hypothetical protein